MVTTTVVEQELCVRVVKARLPEELVLDLASYPGGPCPGDDCNDDSGGCTHDASCGQDC
jgi:hypothetical protein